MPRQRIADYFQGGGWPHLPLMYAVRILLKGAGLRVNSTVVEGSAP